ncbi:hypothetical protein C8R46DRAFT_1183515 [Mycena filopes]|nr:hypothetical protein C8R46DRAFT_1183515 [Mycena filopes]
MSLLDADRRHIAEIDAQISELEAAISALRGRKVIAQERLDAYKYPVLTLPPEIVSEIFTHFLPTYPDCPSPTGALSPTRLTQICRAWREISLGTPSLWRAIDLSPKVDRSPARIAQEFDTWVRRSGLCPMAVKFNFLPGAELSSEGLLTSIAAQRARLEHLVLLLEDTESLHPFSGPMPRLRHLDLKLDDYYRPDSAILVFPESDAPLLRTVLLDFNPVLVALPWTQLTSLTLRYVFPSGCSPVLEQTPNLIFCHLNLIFDDHPGPNPITLRHLTSLKLEALDPIPHFLHALTVPSLRGLDLPEHFLGPNPLQTLASFMSKSNCSLQELIMRENHMFPRNLRRSTYREAFPLINVSFVDGDGEEDTDDSLSTDRESAEFLDEESGSESE